MENSESDEPDKKRPHLDSPVSPAMSRNHASSPTKNQTVDVMVLHHQNQKLVQQLDLQKRELRDLEAKIAELKGNQASYDEILITTNQVWNQLVDDLVLLSARAGGGPNVLQTFDDADYSRGIGQLLFLPLIVMPLSSTLLKCLFPVSSPVASYILCDAIIQLSRLDDMMREEARNLQEVIDILHVKHKEYMEGIENYTSMHSTEQSEISRLAGELEECMAELEDSRRKLINLEMQKDTDAEIHGPIPSAANGSLSPEKSSDRSKGLRELRDSIEEIKLLAAARLSELQDAQEENQILSKDLEVLQADRSSIVRREKEVSIKLESADFARNSIASDNSGIEELEAQLQKCKIEKNDLEIKAEEAVQDSGRKDIKAEFRVMASALSKEMSMMEVQLNRWKQTADEALALQEKSRSLKALLIEKTNEQDSLAGKCAEQVIEIKTLKTQVESLQKEKLELQTILDMYGQEGSDNRDVMELNEAIAIKEKDAEAFISEIETVGQAYEDMQTQNQHLLQQVTERDDYNIKLVSDSVKTKQAHGILVAEKQALTKQLQQLNASIEQVKTRIAHSEEQMKTCFADAIRYTEEERHLAVTLEMARWELTDAEKEQKWIKYAIASSEKEYEQIQKKSDEVRTELENERYERQKVEEELLELNNQIAELISETSEAAIERLQDEINDCKRILKCSVCSDRPKEVVIVKCYHLFCNPCIQRNLELRHRKCPGCGTAFGQSDVRFVKI
ncbi:unnamed protein product [Linum tenue]|uniref:E3 ubiquitin protein ligase n=1 Tax=Linum tenue TaxID=586396 RepID=A0AAV0KHU3_9ROSI|nr:unnamed protein product [Linum tenue]